MKTSNRIKFILAEICASTKHCVKDCFSVTFYDIGCDHGKIGYELLKINTTYKVVFCDVSQTNLNKAKNLVGVSCEFASRADFVCCDGVPKNIKVNSLCVGLIFGLGGETIINIIQKDSSLNEYYLQPTTNILELRDFLYSGEFVVLKDYCFYDGKRFYDFIHIVRNTDYRQSGYNFDVKLLGKDNLVRKDVCFQKYLQVQKHNLGKLLAKVDKNMLQLNVNEFKIEKYKKLFDLIICEIEGA